MSIRSLLASQASGIAIATFVVASMSVQGHQIVSNGVPAVSHNSVASPAQSSGVTKVIFKKIFHTY